MTIEPMDAFILAGGASSRMGQDKATLLLHGTTLIEHTARTLASVATSVAVVGREAAPGHLTTTSDIVPHWGALGGLHAALAACTTRWALVVACDMPHLSPSLLARLIEFREGFEAVAPIQPDGRPQPLCALYRADPCLAHAEKLIQFGERRPVALLQSVNTRWVSFDELNDLPAADLLFENMNTPEDYQRVQAKGVAPQRTN